MIVHGLLKQLRSLQGLTVREFSKRTPFTEYQLSEWESGQVSPTVEELSALLNSIGYNLKLEFEVAPDEKTTEEYLSYPKGEEEETPLIDNYYFATFYPEEDAWENLPMPDYQDLQGFR